MSSGIIQNEYSNGDSLQSLLQERSLVESELKLLLLHVTKGLQNIFFTEITSAYKSPMPPSGSRQPDPYSMDDSTLLLPFAKKGSRSMTKLQYYQQDRFYYYELIIVRQQLNDLNYVQFESCGSSSYWEHDIRNCHSYKHWVQNNIILCTFIMMTISKRWIPPRWNELLGLQYMKIYLCDDAVLISGANLSNDYFTNRQDRYILIEDKTLADLYAFYSTLN
uniref:CDP-diacylglycerol--glycerol-3-phosphate 3-phosphatidyltransferase n=1 Tax=Glossina palpalis gambiensis TaxID=67801 RepID=A0A1B0BLK9_9MUSC